MKKKLSISIGLCLFTFALWCQDSGMDKWHVYEKKISQYSYDTGTKSDSIAVLVKFTNSSRKKRLQKKGMKIVRILDADHAIMSMSYAAYIALEDKTSILPCNSNWKLSPSILNNDESSMEQYIIKSTAIRETLTHINRTSDISVIGQQGNYIHIYGSLARIKTALLSVNNIRYIGQESYTAVQESAVPDLNLTVNNINKIYKEYPRLNGLGITISLKDKRFFENDIDLIDKLVNSPLLADTFEQHPTDMATIIAGVGNSSIRGKGVAPLAKIQSSDLFNLMPDPSANLSGANIFTQNHSYGTAIENFYGSLAASYDSHIHNNPNELHIFSSGNEGGTVPENGSYAGIGNYANLTGNFKMAKNNLIVGAIDDQKNSSFFSSKGPAYDGRVKPELVSYSIIGTSNATAITSGVSAIVQQAYIERNGSPPLASLQKAVLINSADDIGTQGPDYSSGFGSLNGYAAVNTIMEERYIVDEIGDSESKIFSVTIPENTQNLKITVVWTDTAAEINSNLALVNDLDMVVLDPANTIHNPWILDATPNLQSIASAAQRGEDHLNNIEQILVENLVSGTYAISISGFDIATENQQFSIAYSWEDTKAFEWTYPLVNENYPFDGETQSYFRWESSFDTDNGSLSISYDNGENWELISQELTLSGGFYLWEDAPENINSTAILRMTVENTEFLSDVFTISNAINLGVGLDCENLVQLRWEEQNGVRDYRIYNLQDGALLLRATTKDTTYVFNKNTIDTDYFSIQAVLENGDLGIIGPAIDFQSFETGCYESFIIAEISEDKEAGKLDILLSSTFNIDTIEIERKNGEFFETINSMPQPQNLEVEYLDKTPLQGLNTYRIKTTTVDGNVFFSEEAELFFLTTTPFITFPNPILEGVTVLTKDFGDDQVWLEMYSMDGRLVLVQEITSDEQFVFMQTLRQGIYSMVLYADKSSERSSQLVYKL